MGWAAPKPRRNWGKTKPQKRNKTYAFRLVKTRGQKITYMSSSDKFLLKPTRENNKYSEANGRCPSVLMVILCGLASTVKDHFGAEAQPGCLPDPTTTYLSDFFFGGGAVCRASKNLNGVCMDPLGLVIPFQVTDQNEHRLGA